jgi:altronate dehydratase
MKSNAITINPRDNVAVTIEAIKRGEAVRTRRGELHAAEDIPPYHKVALQPIAAGEGVIRYGEPIGVAAAPIATGGWVHTHNLASGEA